jgi:hypothetical protein
MKRKVLRVKVLFEGRLLDAYAQLSEQGYRMCFRVRYNDKSLTSLLPEGRLLLHFPEGLIGDLPRIEGIEELIHRTSEAISEGMETCIV